MVRTRHSSQIFASHGSSPPIVRVKDQLRKLCYGIPKRSYNTYLHVNIWASLTGSLTKSGSDPNLYINSFLSSKRLDGSLYLSRIKIMTCITIQQIPQEHKKYQISWPKADFKLNTSLSLTNWHNLVRTYIFLATWRGDSRQNLNIFPQSCGSGSYVLFQ